VTVEEKKWYLSRTFYMNGLMLLAAVANGQLEFLTITPEVQAAALVLINVVLRVITKTNLTW